MSTPTAIPEPDPEFLPPMNVVPVPPFHPGKTTPPERSRETPRPPAPSKAVQDARRSLIRAYGRVQGAPDDYTEALIDLLDSGKVIPPIDTIWVANDTDDTESEYWVTLRDLAQYEPDFVTILIGYAEYLRGKEALSG